MFNICFQKQTEWWEKKGKEKVVKYLGWWLSNSGKLGGHGEAVTEQTQSTKTPKISFCSRKKA